MALYVDLEANGEVAGRSKRAGSFCWHVGESHPFIVDGSTTCVELQADGDELDLIRSKFSGIPMYAGKVVVWKGETARFIIDNL